jgi:DNA (cytosine-5)-methyltransferase 1
MRNICPYHPESVICQDVRSLNIKNLPHIDAFAYGFPCNDFSIVGEQKGFDGKFGPLYTYGVNIIDYFNPKFFVAENVGGIASANDGKAFKKILSDLENAGNGYALTAHLYKAEEYGVPQTRRRVIIVGFDKKLDLKFKVPAPVTPAKHKTAKEALENPPILKDAHNNEVTSQSRVVVERLKYIRPGENAWTAGIPDNLKLKVRGENLSQIYKRLDPNKPSYTLTGSGGGGTHGYHWEEPRALTNRERARIQTFPDTFIFEGSKESVRKQIGMAVPPKLSEAIFSAVLKTFAGVEYENVSPNIGEQISLFNNF